MISRRVIPMGTSTRPVLLIFPTRLNTFVPLLDCVPILEYQSAPLLMINGTLAHVSTLFRLDGRSHNPFSDVWIYLALGSPGIPSSDAISAVDSPHTKAPPPLLIDISKSNREPSIFLPSRPCSRACSIAIVKLATASGYSFLTYI